MIQDPAWTCPYLCILLLLLLLVLLVVVAFGSSRRILYDTGQYE